MEVAPFFVDFHHLLSIFTIFYQFSRFTLFCRDLHFVAIYALFPQIYFAQNSLLRNITCFLHVWSSRAFVSHHENFFNAKPWPPLIHEFLGGNFAHGKQESMVLPNKCVVIFWPCNLNYLLPWIDKRCQELQITCFLKTCFINWAEECLSCIQP